MSDQESERFHSGIDRRQPTIPRPPVRHFYCGDCSFSHPDWDVLKEHGRAVHRGHPVPRFKKLVQWVAILSEGEADACIRDYRDGQEYCCEAVNHFGGTEAVIQRAMKMRPVHRDWGRTS